MSQTASYADITSETSKIVVDAIASSNERALNYAKSLWEIVSRPLASDQQYNVRDGFERADQIVTMTVKELEASIKKSAEFAEKIIGQGTKLQEQSIETLRSLAGSGLSNAKSVVEAAGDGLETLSKRVEETADRAVETVSKTRAKA